MKHPIKFGILTGVLAGALIFALNSFAFHGGPTQQIEGLHDEGSTIADGTQKPVLIGGDDGTSLKSINVDATTGDVQVDVTNTITADLGANNDVVLTAGLLHADSPTTEAAIVKLFNAGDITATNMGASTAITIAGTGTLTKICVILTTGTITTAEDGNLIFFTSDPTISENTADLTVVKAKQISSIMSLTGTDFTTQFATAQVNCQSVDEPYTALTHVLWHATGASSYTDEIIDLLVTYRRTS